MSQQVVEQAKADLEARGEDLTGACGAHKITRLAVWRLKQTGAGLLEKSGGERCVFQDVGYKTDGIAFKDGTYVDCLIAAGGFTRDDGSFDPGNVPAWQVQGPFADIPGRWREPIDPGDAPPSTPGEPPVSSDLAARLALVHSGIASALHEAARGCEEAAEIFGEVADR
jgi:hypothetical protein